MILNWFGKRAGAEAGDTSRDVLESFTGSPAAVMQQVFDFLEEHNTGDEAGLSLLLQADTRLAPVLEQIKADLATHRRIGTGYKLLRTYCEHFARAYTRIALNLPSGHERKLIASLRAITLFSWACRLARMTYNDPSDLRKESLAFYQAIQHLEITAKRQSPYPNAPETSVRQELGILLLWETAPFETLTLEQVEYLERFMVAFGHQIILKAVPGTGTPYPVLADGRMPPPNSTDAKAAVLFVGPGTMAGLMAGINKLKSDAPLPEWAGTPLPHTDLQTLKALAQRMLVTWEQKQIRRNNERQERQDRVLVTGGFLNVRRVVAYAAYVRSGGTLEAYGTREQSLDERVKEIVARLQQEKGQLAPTEILAAMESVGNNNAIESWLVTDSSPRGYSLAVPSFRSWLAVGSLLAIREMNQIDWHVGIVRRLYGPAGARRVGVELYRGVPLPIGMGQSGQMKGVSLADLHDAIMVDGEADNILVTDLDCSPEGIHLIAGQRGRQIYRINTRIFGTAEYQIYLCQLVPEK